jgi:PAS domain S-box-containing protein
VRWGLVVQQAEAEVYATRNRVAWLVIAACVALLLVTVPLAVTFSVRATRPITSLLRAMERFGAGEIALPGGLPEHGELGRLAAAFRQMTQDRLRTERRYHEIVTTTDDLITEVDGDGRLVFVNPVAERVFGLAPAGILGRSAFSFVHPDDRAKTEAWFAACIASRQQQATLENRQVAEDGGRISHFLWTCHISYDAQGRFSGMTGIAHDVTERRRAEEERRRLDERLAQSQKLESIGTLAGGVAHDFNNVLGAIVGYGSTLLSRMSPDDPLRLYAEQVLASAERGAGLTQGLLAFSRKQIINPRTIDLNASVRKVSDLLARLIGEDVALRIACAPQPLPIFADPTQVEQVLMNLATNARDAMPKGGALAITTEPVDGGAIPGAPEGARPHALLSVTDTGVGMDEETRARIFEPFFTTKEIGRGTGLGLAIVYGIVQQSHGSITVYSEPGKGTTFRIYLPLAAALPVGLGAEPPSAPARGGTETILLAEDDRAIRAIFRQVLSESGYRIIEAADGEAALRSFEERADEIELIVSDVVMPRKSGGELFRAAKARKPGVKVIFTSGYPADVVEEIGVLDEGVHFVPKPTTPQALLRKIREVLDGEAG